MPCLYSVNAAKAPSSTLAASPTVSFTGTLCATVCACPTSTVTSRGGVLAMRGQAPSASFFAGHVLGCTQCSKGLGINNPLLTRHNLPLPVPVTVLNDLYARTSTRRWASSSAFDLLSCASSPTEALVTTSSSSPVLVPNLP